MAEAIPTPPVAPQAAQNPPAAPAEPPKPDPRFEMVAKREKELQAERARIKSERDALEADRRKVSEFEQRRQIYTRNPLAVLQDAFPGMDPLQAFEMLSKAAQNGGKPTVEAETFELRRELQALKEQNETWRKQVSEESVKSRQQAEAQAVESFKSEIGDFLESNKEAFELTHLHGQGDRIYNRIEKHYSETGEVLTIKQAAEEVEKALEADLDKLAKAAKFAARWQPKNGGKTPGPTLTNGLTASPPVAARPGSDAERIARAIAALPD